MFSWGGFPCNPYINLTRVGSVHQRLVLSTSLSVCVLCKSVIKAGKPKKKCQSHVVSGLMFGTGTGQICQIMDSALIHVPG